MEQHLRAGERPDLVDPADVIGMAVCAYDAGDVLERTAHPREVRAQEPRRPSVTGVDERDLVAVDEEIRLRADESHHMDVW